MQKKHLVLSLSIAAFFILLFAPGLRAAGENSARVKFLIGKVEIMANGKTDWKRARMRQEVNSGDRIRTSLNSRIEIKMPDGSVIKINENTTFDVKEIKVASRDKEDSMSFTLWAGNIWAKFRKVVSNRQKRTIESPSAVVAIRGTTLDMNVDMSQNTLVRVFEGRVSVKSPLVAGEVFVCSNQQSTVEKGKAPTPPRAISGTTEGSGTAPGAQEKLVLKVEQGKLQYTDPVVLVGGVPVRGRVTRGAQVQVNGVPQTVQANGVFNGRARVQEGLNEIRFEATLADQKTAKSMRIYVNTRRPEIRLSTPLVSGFINRRDYSLSGAVFDPTPKDKVKVYINNELITEVMGQGSFNRTIILKEGKNNIRISAVDFSGNRSEKAQQIVLDTVKPIVTVTEPAQQVFTRFEPARPPEAGYRFSKERFRQVIRGVVIDPSPSSGIKRITVNGTEVKPHTDGSFETEILLTRGITGQPGENRLIFYVEDMAGNITRDKSHVIFIR